MYRVIVNFEQNKLNHVTIEKVKPGQSLLELVLANHIELNHECGGVCTCTTCHLDINKGMEHIEEMSKREKDFLQKVENAGLNARLGCQCLLIKGKGEIVITIPDQAKI